MTDRCKTCESIQKYVDGEIGHILLMLEEKRDDQYVGDTGLQQAIEVVEEHTSGSYQAKVELIEERAALANNLSRPTQADHAVSTAYAWVLEVLKGRHT